MTTDDLAARGIRIKPLVWRIDRERANTWVADGIGGPCRIVRSKTPKDKFHEVNHAWGVMHDTLAEAQAASNVGRFALICAALELTGEKE